MNQPPTNPTPDFNDPAVICIGRLPDSAWPAHLDLTRNIFLWGKNASGTTTLTWQIMAAAVADPDCALWVIDIEPGSPDTLPFLRDLLSGTSSDLPVDWLATTMEEAATMTRMAVDAARQRKDGDTSFTRHPAGQPPRILIVFASGADQIRYVDNDTYMGHSTSVWTNLTELAQIGKTTGISTVVASKLSPIRTLGVALVEHIDTFIAVGFDPDGLSDVFGPDAPTRGAGRYRALVGNTDNHLDVALNQITEDQIVGVTVNPAEVTDNTVAGSMLYTTRWMRTLVTLLGEPVTDQFHHLGRPTLPKKLSEATRAQIAYALRMSPSAGSASQAAAVELLINACDGLILDAYGVRSAMRVEGQTLYVRWPALHDLAAGGPVTWHDSGVPHPDGRFILRLAVHLATGGLTASNVETIVDCLEDLI